MFHFRVRKRALEKRSSHSLFQLFSKKNLAEDDFFGGKGKREREREIYIYIHPKKHLKDQVAQQHCCWANLALNLSLPLKLGSQLPTAGEGGLGSAPCRIGRGARGWRAEPVSGGGWELYSMRQGTPRVGSQKCQGESSRWYHWNIKNEALVFFLD